MKTGPMRLQEVGVNLIKAINATSRRNRYETHPENRTKSKSWSQTGSVQSLSDRRWTHTHPHYSSSTHMDSQTLPTHSVLFFLSSSRLSLLWDAAVVPSPDLTDRKSTRL